jgi:DNA repair ATPase RecN
MGRKVVSASTKGKPKKARKQKMTDDQIVAYVARLEQALGDDEKFLPILEELNNAAVAELVAIASKFVAPMPASSSKKSAIERIRKRHENLTSFKRKQKAVGGRSAA